MRTTRGAPPIPLIFAALSLTLSFALAGCGSPGSQSGTTVKMTVGDFEHPTYTAKVGEAVHFTDPASAATHVLCIGVTGVCAAGASGPAELTSADGLTFEPGDTKDVTFAAAGTYRITCTIHPAMNMTLTVG